MIVICMHYAFYFEEGKNKREIMGLLLLPLSPSSSFFTATSKVLLFFIEYTGTVGKV